MGGLMSRLWWGGDPDAPSPVSGLSRRDIHAVQKSWAPVDADSAAIGAELLKRYFRAYPQAKQYFKMIKNLPEEEYDSNIQFKAHVASLMSSLALAVRSLAQPELVAVLMRKLGESHGKRNIQEQHFHDLKNVIVKMFIEVLRPDAAALSAWGRTLDFWYEHIFHTLSARPRSATDESS